MRLFSSWWAQWKGEPIAQRVENERKPKPNHGYLLPFILICFFLFSGGMGKEGGRNFRWGTNNFLMSLLIMHPLKY